MVKVEIKVEIVIEIVGEILIEVKVKVEKEIRMVVMVMMMIMHLGITRLRIMEIGVVILETVQRARTIMINQVMTVMTLTPGHWEMIVMEIVTMITIGEKKKEKER